MFYRWFYLQVLSFFGIRESRVKFRLTYLLDGIMPKLNFILESLRTK